jgi:hypothetical protein
VLLILVAATCLADVALRAPTPWESLPDMALRFVLVWTPICLLAQVPSVGGRTMTGRLVLLTTAFLVQCGVHRGSLPGTATGLQVLSCLLATAGSFIALGGGRP